MLDRRGLKRGTTTGGGADKHAALNAQSPAPQAPCRPAAGREARARPRASRGAPTGWRHGGNRAWNPPGAGRPEAATAAGNSRTTENGGANGFSVNNGFPDAATASTYSRWNRVGVMSTTASTSGSVITS